MVWAASITFVTQSSILLAFFLVRSWSWSSFSSHSSLKNLRKYERGSFLLRCASDEGEDKPILPLKELLLPDSKCNPTQMSPTSLAYIGDSVFELFVRSRYVWPTRRTTDLQKIVVDKVRAETQSMIFQSMLSSESFQLTKEEKTIVSRGRNAGSSSGGRKRGPKRLYASGSKDGKNVNSGPGVYQDSTAIEALIGYVYLTDQGRCAELMRFICKELDQLDDK